MNIISKGKEQKKRIGAFDKGYKIKLLFWSIFLKKHRETQTDVEDGWSNGGCSGVWMKGQ